MVGNVPGHRKLAPERRLHCARGPLDPFKLFVERAAGWTRIGGRWGLILPDIILLKDYQPIFGN